MGFYDVPHEKVVKSSCEMCFYFMTHTEKHIFGMYLLYLKDHTKMLMIDFTDSKKLIDFFGFSILSVRCFFSNHSLLSFLGLPLAEE